MCILQLPEIIRAILLLHLENEMPCFDARNVIFITNKWNTLYSEDDSSGEDEETKTWNTLKTDIKRRWPSVREELIFKMNLKDVICCSKKIIFTEHFIIKLEYYEANKIKKNIGNETYLLLLTYIEERYQDWLWLLKNTIYTFE